ncbi:MAG: branched-chain amino acid ABC transporter permease [Desulfobacterales bacterium]|nr:branched-chain amino acid ABC transporter permease [Desulfobacterales bacterium]
MPYYFRRFYKTIQGEIFSIPGRAFGFIGILVLFLLGFMDISPHLKNLLIFCSIFALLAASWDFLFFSGQLNLGHGAFFGASAYASAILSVKLGLPVWVTIPMGAVAGVLIGVIVAIPALRLRGPYLAIVTLAVPAILQGIVFLFPNLTGGELGLFGLPSISDSQTFRYYFCLVVMLISVGVMWKLTDTGSRHVRTGIIFHALREDEISARTAGINTVKYKMLAFAVSGFFAGISGGLYAHTMKVVGPTTLEFIFSIYPLIWTVFGGPGTIYGPVIGAYLLYFLSTQLLLIFPEIRMALFTAIVIFMILFMPEGITRWIRDKFEIQCSRCKAVNYRRRKTCRVCQTPVSRAGNHVKEREKEVAL